MSGIIGHSGSKSGLIGLVSDQWKLLETRDLTNESGNNGLIHFTTASCLTPNTFLKYRMYATGLRISSGSEAELRLRWSCVAGATVGDNNSNYFGARWSKHSSSSAGVGNDIDNAQQDMRVCYMNDNSGDGVQTMVIETENVGVSDVDGNSQKYGFMSYILGYVAFTSTTGYGPCISGAISTHANCKATASGGELTCITLCNSENAFTHGTIRLYGLVK